MKNNNRTTLILIIGLLIIVMPLVVAKLMNIQVFKWMSSDNDWIGFWGSYLGGFITLIGVFLTIQYAREEEINRQKLAIRPYINIERFYNNEIVVDPYIPLQKIVNETEELGEEYSVRINELFLLCVIKNVGLGTAINYGISQILIEKRSISVITKILPALQVNGISYIKIIISQIDLHEEDLSSCFLTENNKVNESDKNSKHTNLRINIKLEFEDLLGNHFFQDFAFNSQASGHIPLELPAKMPIDIDCIKKPQESRS